MATINLDTVLRTDASRSLVEQILDEELLSRVVFDGPLANKKAYALSKAMPMHAGQYWKFTRKQHVRQPETDPMTSGASSDPASGITLGTDLVLLPIESHRQYGDIDVLAGMTSWIDLEEWVRNDIGGIAWPRKMHRLIQAAFVNGRNAPGAYNSSGVVSTSFDATAEASLTRFGLTFTYAAAPRSYAGGAATFADLVTSQATLKWSDIRARWVGMDLARAPKIKASDGPGYMFVMSSSCWNDLVQDDDGGRLTAAIAGGLKSAIKGLESYAVFFYAGAYIVIDDDPYTFNAASEVARADWGDYHAVLCFGNEAYGMTSLGSKGMRNFKVTDTTKTGANYSIGARIHWSCCIVNQNWCNVMIAKASITQPNNYSVSNKQTYGFSTTSAS